jgi:periplasmic divalent cation tolerance protein
MNRYLQVFTTIDDAQAAERLARGLVEANLAACVQIAGPITSVYRWKGRVEQAREWLCIIKSREPLYRKIEAEIKRLHPYEVPEIIAAPICKGNPNYFSWLKDATASRPPARPRPARRK